MARQQRKIFLINPKFQIRFSVIMCSIVFLTSLFYPITIFVIIVKVFDQSKLVSPETINVLVQYKQALILILILLLEIYTEMKSITNFGGR